MVSLRVFVVLIVRRGMGQMKAFLTLTNIRVGLRLVAKLKNHGNGAETITRLGASSPDE